MSSTLYDTKSMSSTSRLKWKCPHRSKNRSKCLLPNYITESTNIHHKQSLNSDDSYKCTTTTTNGSIDNRHPHYCIRSSPTSSLSMPITYKCSSSSTSSKSILPSDRQLIWQFIVNMNPIKNQCLYSLFILLLVMIAIKTVSTEKAS